MANSALGLNVYIYVDPVSKNADSMHMFSVFGAFVRLNGTWVMEDQEALDKNMAELADDLVYSLDWDTDYVAMADVGPDYDEDHVAIELYDKDELTFDKLEQYANLELDPSAPEEEL